ncbi:Rhodanese-like domain-containing protein [Podospora appendiculata]|uniref:Rhodanese-like domain-containing protein n=1 Tax=Podospora appendiculata TaxID=314037 RepID=A0AAE0WZE2_9PEZI|nr:Rhodanese-like domain-containing protein [Podospora appendiculata]
MASTEVKSATTPAPWYAAYPAAQSEVVTISREEVLAMLQNLDGKSEDARDFVLVDLRRNDFEGGTIRGSINLPAQSLYPTLPVIYGIFKAAGLKKVIWYCGSSRGRGSRATAWFSDYLLSVGDTSMESLALAEGVRGWASAGEKYVALIDEYDEAVWTKTG